MPHPTPADWTAVDWSLSNHDIARLVGRSVDRVIRMRGMLATVHGARKPRSDIDRIRAAARSPENRARARLTQPIATEAAQASPLAGRGVKNVHAKRWRFRSPGRQVFAFVNLYEFLRAHTHLFAPADLEWKRTGGQRGTGGEYCNASAGLLGVAAGRAKSWKEWTKA